MIRAAGKKYKGFLARALAPASPKPKKPPLRRQAGETVSCLFTKRVAGGIQ